MSFHNLLVKPETNALQKEAKIHVFRPDHMDDHALWNSFRSGDEQALVIIFDRTVKKLHSYGTRITSDKETIKDAVQDLFIELWRNRQNLGETDSITFYLYKCLRRKLVRMRASSSLKVFVSLSQDYEQETFSSQEALLVAEQVSCEAKQRVMTLLDKLTRRQREAVFLRFIEEMDYDKIAEVMELRKQVVYNLVHKAIDALKNSIPFILAGVSSAFLI